MDSLFKKSCDELNLQKLSQLYMFSRIITAIDIYISVHKLTSSEDAKKRSDIRVKRIRVKELFVVLMNAFDQLSEKIIELADSGMTDELKAYGFEMEKYALQEENDIHRAIRYR